MPVLAQGEATGVFDGDFVGCAQREDVLRFYAAKRNRDDKTAGDLLASGACLALDGHAYEALHVGFRTSLVRVADEGRLIEIYAPTDALRASPPSARSGFFNF